MAEDSRAAGAPRAADLKETQERLRLALHGARLGTWDWHLPSDRVVFDERWAAMIGYTIEELPQTYSAWAERVHPDDLQNAEDALQAHFDGRQEYYEVEFRLRTKRGPWKWILSMGRIVATDDDGTPLRMTGTHLDIDARKRAEAERERAEVQMLHAQKMESLGVLAGGVAHDFNNLLVGILGNVGLLLSSEALHPSFRPQLEAIETSAVRAADLARQMLTYAGRSQPQREELQLEAAYRELLDLLRSSISHNIHLSLHVGDELPSVIGDVTQLRQVLMNLVLNAGEAIGDGNGTVQVRLTRRPILEHMADDNVVGAHVPAGTYLRIEVEDDGPGMDAETQARIFDPFFSTKPTGRGLGLASTLGIVRAHDGVVRLNSRAGRGSCFEVLLPDEETSRQTHEHAERPRAPDTPTEPPTAQSEEPTGRGVLVVDDESIVLDLASATLEREGFQALRARDGLEAIEIFEQHAARIDAVVLDMSMPRLDGVRALEELRARRPKLPVVLCSGYVQSSVEGLEVEFLGKPYRPQELVDAVRRSLSAPSGA